MSAKRKSLSKRLRRAVWEKTKGFCYYCKVKLLPIGVGEGQPNAFTVEHDTPLCHGGSDSLFNLFPCCAKCNHERVPEGVPPSEYDDATPLTHRPFANSLTALMEQLTQHELLTNGERTD